VGRAAEDRHRRTPGLCAGVFADLGFFSCPWGVFPVPSFWGIGLMAQLTRKLKYDVFLATEDVFFETGLPLVRSLSPRARLDVWRHPISPESGKNRRVGVRLGEKGSNMG